MKKVIISNPFLDTILVNCLRNYKKETIGLLTGSSSDSRWDIENAFFIKRGGYSSIDLEDYKRGFSKLSKLIDDLDLNIIGDFHCHTDSFPGISKECYVTPSSQDLEDMIKNPEWIYFILAIKEQKKKSSRKRSSSGGFYSSIGQRFYCNFEAFSINLERKRKYDTVKIIIN